MFDGNNTRDYSPSWALGTSFLKPYCLVIDYEHQMVSFAKIPGKMIAYHSVKSRALRDDLQGPNDANYTYNFRDAVDVYESKIKTFKHSKISVAIVAIAASSIMVVCVATGLIVFCKYRQKFNRR